MGPLSPAEGCGKAKLLLFGEHAAVYGHPAVGLSLPESIRARVTPGGGKGWRFPDAPPEERPRLARLLRRFGRIIPELRELPGGEVRLASGIPSGRGFGSSAALCAALAAALCAAMGLNESMDSVWAYAHEAERLFHGTPSGIDTGLALLDGLYLFHPAPPRLPEARRLEGLKLPLVIGSVPRRDQAGRLIQRIRAKMQAGESGTVRRIGELGAIARRAGEILAGGGGAARELRLKELGLLAWRAQEHLAALQLSTPELDRLLEAGRRAGALGAKLSGAGGGGAFFMIFASPQEAFQAVGLLQAPEAGIRALVWSGRSLRPMGG